MATIMRDREHRSSKAELMSAFSFDMRSLAPSQYAIKKRQDIPDPKPAPPVRLLVREIDLAPVDGQTPIAFVKPDRSYDISQFSTVLGKVIDRTYTPNGQVTKYYRPLDLKLRLPTRYIIKLSDRWDWRFSYKANAVTLGEFVNMPEQNKYCDLWHVRDDGQLSDVPFPEDFCRIAYFDADPVSADFHHPFNLNVELVFADGGGADPNSLPIVIDPDVRYPGGSGD